MIEMNALYTARSSRAMTAQFVSRQVSHPAMNDSLPTLTSGERVPSLDRVQRILAVDVSYTISRMQVLERLPGNPIGIRYRWVDETAVALMSRLPSFSRVVGLRAEHEPPT
jgi:hypothetical protein